MAEGRIIIDVDDTALQIYIAELRQAINLSQQAFGTTSVTRGITTTKKQADDLVFSLIPVTDEMNVLTYQMAQMGLATLPGVNRELRLILGQIPGMSTIIRQYFNIKRLQRGLGDFITTGGGMQLTLSLIATAILLLRMVQQHQKNIERQQRDYELFIARERGWTHQEFVKGRANWEEFYRSLSG